MRQQGTWWIVGAAVLAAVVIGLSARQRRQASSPDGQTPGEPGAGVQRPAPVPGEAGLATATGAGATAVDAAPGASPRDGVPPRGTDTAKAAPEGGAKSARPKAVQNPDIALLNDLLDGDNRAGTLAQARKMIASRNAEVRTAALEALRWLGGRDVVNDLAAMLGDADPEIAEDAADSLVKVLDEVDDPALSAAMLEQAIKRVPPDATAEGLFLSLSGLPEEVSVPALLNLLESRSAALSALAREYLEFVTGGQEISNRAQGEAWLRARAKADEGTEKK
jgi:hypothetical protein